SGFDAEVLAALDDARADRRPPFPGRTDRLPGRTDRRERRRPLLLAAASVLVGIAVGAGVATGLGERDEVAPAASSQWEAPLVDSGGDNVGTVTHSWSTDGPALVVQIDEGSVGYRYTCRLILADGNTEEVGEWQLAQGRPNSWVVPAPDGEVEVVEMVTTGGQVWSTAEF